MAKIIIKDNSGNQVTEFKDNGEDSIGVQAQDSGADIPFSCGVGACRTCVGKCTSGKEHINPEAIGPQHIDVEDDEILTCIAGIKEDAPDDAKIEIECENL